MIDLQGPSIKHPTPSRMARGSLQSFLRFRVAKRFTIIVGLVMCMTLANVSADERRDKGMQELNAGNYAAAYAAWSRGAAMGDGEQQELVANLLLGPHGHAVKHDRSEGTRYLYLAAVMGRRTAMSTLADVIEQGKFGLEKRPDAASCWSKAPPTTEGRIVCVGLTEFDDSRARPPCARLPFVDDQKGSNKDRGRKHAKLCLANKTPALMVPGPPPGSQAEKRAQEYARHGIEWIITGDVYETAFEEYREEFNATVADAIEKAQGRGYLAKLSKDIEDRIAADERK